MIARRAFDFFTLCAVCRQALAATRLSPTPAPRHSCQIAGSYRCFQPALPHAAITPLRAAADAV